jgi:hypothetical protein
MTVQALISSAGAIKTIMRSMMNTNLKVILTAIGIAVLASPVMAQSSESRSHAPQVSISNARGSVSHARVHHPVSTSTTEGSHLDDCVHTAFPQCGNGE